MIIDPMTNPLITIIIPTYKRPRLLKRAILNALNQTFTHIQVRVYDDASNDETEGIVRKCMEKDRRVVYHRHEQNIGLMQNYLYSLLEVKTDYFSFLSDDDVLFPWFCEETLQAFQQFPECAFSTGSAIIMSEEGKVIRVPLDLWKREGVFFPPEGLLEMISKYPIPSCTLFHRKVIDTISMDMSNSLTWDCDFLLQNAARFPFYISKRPCGIYLHHSSYSNSKGFDEWNFSLKRMIDRINLNPHLNIEIKRTAAELINKDLKRLNKPIILRNIYNKQLRLAYNSAFAFRKNQGLNLETFVLLNLVRLCLWFPSFISVVLWIRKLKNFKKQRAFRHYKHYAKWLASDEK
jgi:glycosyltransferase involved in cell wall biosynthesis